MAEKRDPANEESETLEAAEAAVEGRPEREKEGGEATFRRESRKDRKTGRDENVVFVGKKPTMSYVLAVITQFSDGNSEVFVKARGRSISTAVDVVEVVKKKFMQGLKCEIETDTEVITDERNQRINVSTISAKLFK